MVDLSRKQLVASRLEQAVVNCMANEKDAYLHLLLKQRPGRVIVFCNAISCLRRCRSLLERMQVPVIALQGDMQQRARLKAVDRFVAQPRCVLLATDVAARGLDFPAVDYVVHFQLPRSSETYVHRSGRTARAEASGLSVSDSRRAACARALHGHRTGMARAPHGHGMGTARAWHEHGTSMGMGMARAWHVHCMGTAWAWHTDALRALQVSLVEPAEQKSYRKLCHELGEADGLPELELDLRQISRHRKIAALALQLDRVAHKEQRESANRAWRQKLTKEMELPTDSEDEEEEEDEELTITAGRQQAVQHRDLAQKQQQLTALLKKLG